MVALWRDTAGEEEERGMELRGLTGTCAGSEITITTEMKYIVLSGMREKLS